MITGLLPTKMGKTYTESKHSRNEITGTMQAKKTFLYIGDASERTTKCLNFFDHGYIKTDFEAAKVQLLHLYEHNLHIPDFIIVDQPLQEKGLLNFMLWLHANAWSFMIPVLYNETVLNTEELVRLKSLCIADDIVNIEEYCSQLGEKASFLKSFKSFGEKRENTPTIKAGISVGKRIFDILFASAGLIILAPVMAIIMVIIKLESKGPSIYRSKRAGKGFKIFNFYKFRSMIVDAEEKMQTLKELNLYAGRQEKHVFFKMKDDPRITRFGAFLRNTSLDELPQLFNVLKGDMSIVGNRPLPLYEASTLTTNTGAERFVAPAGITGLWQVTKRGREEMSGEERLALDIRYSRNQGPGMDWKILLHTPLALFQKTNV